MSDYPVTRGSRAGDPHLRLRLAALTAVIAGVVLVALAAFLLSYEGIHQIALQAGVSPALAKLYPLMLDAMLVVACSAALALRNAGWWTKFYVWVSLLLVLGAVAAGDALHATGVRLTSQPARAVIAIIPWVLLLMGFGMWLVMLRQWRKIRAAAAVSRSGAPSAPGGTGASNGTGDGHAGRAIAGSAAAAGSATTWAGGRGAAPVATGAHRAGIDTLLERPADLAPDRAPAPGVQAAESRSTPGDKPALPRRPPVPGQRIPTGAAGVFGARAAAARAGAARARGGAAGAAGPTEAASTEAASTETAGTRAAEAGTTEAETASTGTTGATDTETVSTGTAQAETASTGTTGATDTEAASTGTAQAETASTGTTGATDTEAASTGTASAGTGAPSSGTTGAGAAGASAAGQDGGHAESPESRDGAGRGDGSGLPSGVMTGDDSSVRLLPTDHAASSAATGDQAGPPTPVAAEPALVPHFDRMRSTPTPPGDDGE
jgi:Protein of unknown function (DUF2637)